MNYSYLSNANPAFIEDLFQRYLKDEMSVDLEWRKFFDGYRLGQDVMGSDLTSPLPELHVDALTQVKVVKLIQGYRSRGHLIANTNPIRTRRLHKSDLELDYFGLTEADLDKPFELGSEISLGTATLREILAHLKKTYCASIGVEFMYCRDEKLRQWMYEHMEPIANKPHFSLDEKRQLQKKIDQAVTFENFLQTKYVGKKRFSLEGLEALIPSLDSVIRQAASLGVREFVLGMAHRGRLNVLVNIFEKSYEDVFSEFEETALSEAFEHGGDVKYHLGKTADIETKEGHPVHLSLVPNASHLEAIGPVVQGIAYSKQKDNYDSDYDKIIPIIIHGDSAISGQGVNYESANMSRLDGFNCGGTVHIILNNQVGFTANYKESRSSVYCTDLAKVTESPVFHVSADDPEAVVHVMQLAVKIRQEFHIDVYVDILGYRRFGHNEGDEPRFTQPLLYKAISKHKYVNQIYLDYLTKNHDIPQKEANELRKQFKEQLQEKLDYAKKHKPKVHPERLSSHWKNYRTACPKDFESSINTGVKKAQLDLVAKALTTPPEPFQLFSKMAKLIKNRHELYFNQGKLDWAMAELLSYGSLLIDGHNVRLSGQDSQRGTFSHRHAVIKDVDKESHFIPLNHIQKEQGEFFIYNTLLSEYAAMAFEYGYSLSSPDSLVVWEAQFGDFANGAQIVIDQFLSSSEFKWHRMSGLVLLLPHGYEGQGPEHSSARLERFLQLCAEENMIIANPTTPANYFHLMRRQVKNPFRKPLIVMSPKSLLRHPLVTSEVKEIESGQFQEILDDPSVNVKEVKTVYLCSGKVYYDCLEKRQSQKRTDFALIRLEQLYPLPIKQLEALRKKYKNATWCWIQEESENMGAWTHINRHLREWNLKWISRPASASPATGSALFHARGQLKILNRMLEGDW